MKTNLFLLRTAFLVVFGLFHVPITFAQDWQQTAKGVAGDRLKVTSGTTGKMFGRHVVIEGNYAYVASSGSKDILQVFTRKDGIWQPYSQVTAIGAGEPGSLMAAGGGAVIVANGNTVWASGGSNPIFRFDPSVQITSVAIDSTYAVIGVKDDNLDGSGQNPVANAGAAYLLRRNASGWLIHKKLTAPVRTAINFGTTVAISDFQLIVGTNESAMIFRRDRGGAGNFGFVQSLPVVSSAVVKEHPVAMFGDYAVIGAPYDNLGDVNKPNAGSASVYKKTQDGTDKWNFVQKIQQPNPVAGAFFSDQLTMYGDFIVGVSPFDGNDARVHIFKKSAPAADQWSSVAELRSRSGSNNGFASSVDITGDAIIVGAKDEAFAGYAADGSGAALIYRKNLGGTDVWGKEQTLYSIQTNMDDEFGKAVAISGNYAIVGAIKNDYDANGQDYDTDAGAAYILHNDGSGWKTIKKLVASARENRQAIEDKFGTTVAIFDTLAVVGVPFEGRTVNFGAVYIYSKNQGGTNNWGLLTRLVLPGVSDNTKVEAQFGYSVFINGQYLAIGALSDKAEVGQPDQYPMSGSVYLYERNTANTASWNLVKKIIPPTPAIADHFGASVTMSGDYLLIGSPDDDYDISEKNYLANSGSTFLYSKNTGGLNNWGKIKKITSDIRAANARFGLIVSMSEDYALITSLEYNNITRTGNGSATIYKKDIGGTGNWGLVKKLLTPSSNTQDSFGLSGSINGDYAVVGTLSPAGAAYVYGKNEGGSDIWGQQQLLAPAVAGYDEQFGSVVAIDGRNIIVGAPFDDEDENEANSVVDAGSVFIFHNDTVEPAASMRINSGGSAFAASGNRPFSADQYFSGTSKISSITSGDILNTTDDELYRNGRVGASFSYGIPVTNGTVSVVLHFAELFWGVPGKGGSTGTSKRRFNVNIEGSRKLTNYDIFAAAGGAMRATQQAFTVTVTDGVLNIDFLAGAADNPLISAIEILPVQQARLSPVADATVRNIPYNATNFGSTATLEIKSGSLPSYQRNVYLKFPLDNAGQISSARLRFYGSNSQDNTSINVSAFGIANNSWTESGITWDNAPAVSGSVLGSVLVGNTAQYYEIDVTTFINAQAAGDKTASIFLTNPANQNTQLTFNGRENAASQPQLVIEYGPVPAPVSRISQENLAVAKENIVVSKIYPNPASKLFTVEVSDRHSGKVSLQLTSLSGTAYPIRQREAPELGMKAEIDISSLRLAEGIYVLKIQSDVFTETVKLLVTR